MMTARFSLSIQLLAMMLAPLILSACGRTTSTVYGFPDSPPEGKQAVEEVGEMRPLPDSCNTDLLALVNAYNSRLLGAPAWRRVLLELVKDGRVTRSFTVSSLWVDLKNEARTLFLLEEPSGLRGTNYLLMEDKRLSQGPDMKIYLLLPVGRRSPLEIKMSSFDEGLLGSDFSYNDLRMRLSRSDFDYRLIAQSTLLNEPVWVIEARPSASEGLPDRSWSVARFYLSQSFPLILGADYYTESKHEGEAPALFKQMRVQSFAQVDGIWTPTMMTMFAADGRASVLKLEDIRFDVKLRDAEIFSPAKLRRVAERIQHGLSPSNLIDF